MVTTNDYTTELAHEIDNIMSVSDEAFKMADDGLNVETFEWLDDMTKKYDTSNQYSLGELDIDNIARLDTDTLLDTIDAITRKSLSAVMIEATDAVVNENITDDNFKMLMNKICNSMMILDDK